MSKKIEKTTGYFKGYKKKTPHNKNKKFQGLKIKIAKLQRDKTMGTLNLTFVVCQNK